MTDDEHQARLIIQQWIHKKTGVSEAERAIQKIGDGMREVSDHLLKLWSAASSAAASAAAEVSIQINQERNND